MRMKSALRRISSFSAVTSPMQRMARPGPGKGCRQTMSVSRPSSSPTRRTSSLKRKRRGSGSFSVIAGRGAPARWGGLAADGVGDERGDDRGIPPAGEGADDLAVADPGADGLEALRDEVAHRPVAGAAADAV